MAENGSIGLFDLSPYSVPLDSARSGQNQLRAQRGCVAEHRAIVALLERGHKVAVPVVDDDGVDLIVDYRLTVQVKSTSLAGPTWQFALGGGYYGADGIRAYRQPPDAHIALCFAETIQTWWVVPMRWLREAGLRSTTMGFSLAWPVRRRTQYAALSSTCREAWHLLDEDWG